MPLKRNREVALCSASMSPKCAQYHWTSAGYFNQVNEQPVHFQGSDYNFQNLGDNKGH